MAQSPPPNAARAPHLVRRAVAAVAGLALLSTAACSSGTTSGTGSASTAAASEVTTPAASTAASVPVSSAPASSSGAAGLTPSGTTLAVGQPATVSYEIAPLSPDTTTLSIAVTSVKQGSIADLKDFKLDAQSKTGVPFYVTATFKNVGAKTFTPSGIFGTISALNSAGDEVGRISLIGSFPKCDGSPPDSLPVGADYTKCEVYIAPAGQSVSSVVYHHYVGTTTPVESKITWTVS